MGTGLPDLSLLQHQLAAKTANGLDGSPENDVIMQRKIDVVHEILRLLCMASSVTALSFMVTAHESSTLILYGFQIPVQSKWSNSSSFLSGDSLAHPTPFIHPKIAAEVVLNTSMNFMWLLFAADQVLAYTLTSAGSAASSVTNLNRKGISHTPLPNFCNPLQGFCDHITISMAFTFLGCISLATSAVFDVIRLSQEY